MSPAFLFASAAAAETPGLQEWDFNAFMHHDASITIGSDWGGAFDPLLFPNLERIVKKVGNGSRALGGERLCRMMTLAGAEAVGRQSEFGSIEVGKKANFIAVSQNLAQGEFDGARVLKTWFEGELVWDAADI